MKKEEEQKEKEETKEELEARIRQEVLEEKDNELSIIQEKLQNYNPSTPVQGFSNLEQMFNYAQVLIDSKIVPYVEPEKVIVIMQQGRELGMGPISAINNIHNISGKAALGVHAYTGLAKKHGVDWEVLTDCMYIYPDGHKDLYASEDIIEQHGKPLDRICEIKFYRFNALLNKVITNTVSLGMLEMKSQGLLERDQWKKMPRIMLRTRTLVIGIRLVAPDVFLGVYETSEVADFKNTDVEVSDSGEVKSF